MNDSTLARRQSWFRLFPEGNIEFLLVTRILTFVTLLALGAVQQAQRPMILMALCAVMWLDYVLVVWWAVQMAADLRTVESAEPAGDSDDGRVRAGLLACLPATLLLVILAPWSTYAIDNPEARASMSRILTPALGVCGLASLVPATAALRRLGTGPALWCLLLLVPVVHWPALHRLQSGFHRRIQKVMERRGVPTEEPSPAIPLADATWLLAVLPWIALAATAATRGGWFRYLAPCGAALLAVFSVADVAAIESVQRQFIAVLRRLEPQARG